MSVTPSSQAATVALARQALDIEARAIQGLNERLLGDAGASFTQAVQAMLAGLHIVDYRLHTVRYSMKQTKIPSFLGRIILEAHLPAPLLEMFRTLYVFAPYAGIGIKSALGMGGVKIE